MRVFEADGEMVGAQVCNIEVTQKTMGEWIAGSEPRLTKLEARGGTFRNMTQ